MANLYGVANPVVNLGYYGTIGATGVTCPAGVETNVIQSGTITALDHGIYYPFCVGTMLVQFGASIPTALTFALRLNSGADLISTSAYVPASAASAGIEYSFPGVGPAMPTAFWPPGSNLQISVLAATNGVTVAFAFSNAIMGIMRAADQ